jgi:hypothetical protein
MDDVVTNSDLLIMVGMMLVVFGISVYIDYISAVYFGQEKTKIWQKRTTKIYDNSNHPKP